MRFGGHETFHIREGWLHKGLKLLVEQPALLVDEYAADWLGVGKNMAKSIRHWLVATELARRGVGKDARLEPTELGRLVWERDPYFTEPGTWWALHVNLVHSEDHAAAWGWFFNRFRLNRFDRAACRESLMRHLEAAGGRMPSPNTVDRDLSCLLAGYARRIPPERTDPEEATDCPFLELGLLSYFRGSDYYQLHQGVKELPAALVGYALAKAFPDPPRGARYLEVPLQDAANEPNGPGSVFALTSESLFDLLTRLESANGNGEVTLAGLAGNRVIRTPVRSPLGWLERYYEAVGEGEGA
jgi:hypothetical protein